MYKCSKCKKTGDSGFICYAKTDIKRYYYCNSCNTEKMKRYRATSGGTEAHRRAVLKYEKANKQRQRAWWAVNRQKPTLKRCEECGTTLNVHQHHPDINKPKYVIKLCAYHHKQKHKQNT